MIVNLRGCNGSGKSTVAYGLLGENSTKIDELTTTVGGYMTPTGIIVMGRYETQCGGMDTVKTQIESRDVVQAVDKSGSNGFFEGVLISTIFAPWYNLSTELEQEMVWAFLDTPYELCLERIYKRNGGKKINEKLVRSKFDGINRVADKADTAGERVEWISYENATEEVKELYK
jgi:predicted kinase